MKPRSSVILNRLLARFRIRHFQVLVTLAELGNVRRTAQAIGMTQPAVSLMLAEMERLVDTPLFLRHSRGVTPTAMARDLLPLARHMLADLQSGAEMVAARLDRGEGVVRIGATAAGVSAILSRVLPGFTRSHPRIQVQVEELDTLEVAERLASGSTDIICCRQPAQLPQGWRFLPCVPDRFVVVCGNQHPLRRKRLVRLQDLRDVTWLPNVLASAAHRRQEALLAQLGWDPQSCGILTRISSLTWTLLDSAPLVTLVPLGVVSPWVERGLLHVLPLELDMPFEPTGLLVPETAPSTACETMVRHVLDALQGRDPPGAA